jgi:LAO/AO transport system kinase
MTLELPPIARALSAVENRRPEAAELLRRAYGQARAVPVIGLTGPPGAGKSTLLDHLALQWAESGENVAVIAVDPSSPFTGGAVLGDRFRMARACAHPRVFVRSLASRGHLGGLSRAVHDMVLACGALGFDRVIVETVGSGQSDIEVADQVDCVIVVAVPGLGDQVQASKAGILEIGDVFAVNKSDLPGADTVAGHLQSNLDLVYPGHGGLNPPAVSAHGVLKANTALHERHGQAGGDASFWRPPVLFVAASSGHGVPGLAAACDAFLAWQRATGRDTMRRAERLHRHVLRLATSKLLRSADGRAQREALAAAVRALGSGQCTPDEAAAGVLRALCSAWLGSASGDDR